MQGPRLSEHIILGDTLRKRESHVFYSSLLLCGCAIGGALLSVGIVPQTSAAWERFEQWPWLEEIVPEAERSGTLMVEFNRQFAYVHTFSNEIGLRFRQVCRGELTLEQLAEQVRVWEDLYDDNLKPQPAEEKVQEQAQVREELPV